MNNQILLLAGGGGHTGYAYAIAKYLDGRCGIRSLVPEGDQLSVDKMKQFGPVEEFMKARGPKTGTIPFVTRLTKAMLKAMRIDLSGIDIVVSTGSNFCIPPCAKAFVVGKKIINIESSVRFVKAAITTRYLKHIAALTVLQWQDQKKLFPKGEVFGPLIPPQEYEPTDEGYVFVTGGTLGHRELFRAVEKLGLKNVYLQAGPHAKEFADVPGWKVIESTPDIGRIIAGASYVISHLGATVIESTLVYGKPVIIMINKEWTRTGGIRDASMLAIKVNGAMIYDVSGLKYAINGIERFKPPHFESGAKKLADRLSTM